MHLPESNTFLSLSKGNCAYWVFFFSRVLLYLCPLTVFGVYCLVLHVLKCYKLNLTVFFWLTSLTQHYVLEIHPCYCVLMFNKFSMHLKIPSLCLLKMCFFLTLEFYILMDIINFSLMIYSIVYNIIFTLAEIWYSLLFSSSFS